MSESSNPFREAHKQREAGQLKTRFPGTYAGNVRELPAGGEHELEDSTQKDNTQKERLSSKAEKAARFINEAATQEGDK